MRIDERLSLLESNMEKGFAHVREEINQLRQRQQLVNGAQHEARVRDEEFEKFVQEMRTFKDDLLEWKGAMKKQAGLVGAIAGTIPVMIMLSLLLIRRVLNL